MNNQIFNGILLVVVLGIFSLFIYNVEETQSVSFNKLIDYRLKPIEHIHEQNSSVVKVKKINTNETQALNILKEVKHFNEMLNQKQSDSTRLIIYLIAFISIIGTFFGYKTVKDIRDNARSEFAEVKEFYITVHDNMNKQSDIMSQSFEFMNKQLTTEINKKVEELAQMDEKLQDMQINLGFREEEVEEKEEERKKQYKEDTEENRGDFDDV